MTKKQKIKILVPEAEELHGKYVTQVKLVGTDISRLLHLFLYFLRRTLQASRKISQKKRSRFFF